jgi:predicted dehydrogenase
VSDRIRVGVVGTGWWATQFHLASLLSNPNVAVTALADSAPERLQKAVQHFGIKASFTDACELFASGLVDAVIIATPHATHYGLVKAALEHDLHTLCEKPFVLESQQGYELLHIARQRSLHLMVGYTYQFTRHARLVRDMVRQGKIGELLFVSGLFASMVEAYYRARPGEYAPVFQFPVIGPDARTYSDPSLSGGGQAQTQITHAMNMVFWVTGRRASEVHAYMQRRDLAVDLVDGIAYRFDNGAIGTMGSTGSLRPGQPQQQELRYYGTKGYILQEMIHGKVTFCGNDGSVETAPDLAADELYPAGAVSAGFVNVIRGVGENLADAQTAVATVAFLEAAYRSAATHAPVAVEEGGVASPGRPGHGQS